MKTRRLISLIVVPFLFACFPKKPEISLTEVPAAPFVQALEQRRQAFLGLKALASVQAVRKGRKRSFESVGILLKAQDKFRIEAYGPLGQPMLAILWNGKEVLLRLPGEAGALAPKHSGLERLLGADVEPKELCAVLSGNIPETAEQGDVRALCGQDGVCLVELRQGDALRRVRVFSSPQGAVPDVLVAGYELFRSGGLVFRARFERRETISRYLFPRTVVVENPDRKTSLTVEYGDVEVNAHIDDGEFTLSGMEGTDL